MRRSIMIVGAFCAVALASSTALGVALRTDRSPAGVEHRTLEPPIVSSSESNERMTAAEAIAPKLMTMPPPSFTPSTTGPLPPPSRDISEMTCKPYELSAGTAGSHVMVCE